MKPHSKKVRFSLLALGVIAAACARTVDDAAEQAQIAEANRAAELAASKVAMPVHDASVPDAFAAGEHLGEFKLTYYWVASEQDGHRQPANGQENEQEQEKTVQLYNNDCEPLVEVNSRFASRVAHEGTGKLKDGRTINVARLCNCEYSPCFFIVGDHKHWGVGVGERPLSPFRTVAVDPTQVPIGTLLYIPELDGLTMPGPKPWGGFVHDGCVVANDRGGGVEGRKLDLFMAKKSHYQSFDRRHRLKKVSVYDGKGRCDRDGDTLVPVNRNST